MAILLNKEVYNASLYMGQLENDCIFSGSTSKYKLRKVSAVRDFPPGCHPNVQLAKLRPDDVKVDERSLGVALFNGLETNAVGILKERNEVKARKRSISATRNLSPICGTSTTQEFKDERSRVISGNMSLVEVGNSEVIEKLNYDIKTGLGQPLLCDVDNGTLGETLMAGMETNPVNFWEEMNEAVAHKGRVSAIRDFPPLCGTSAPQEFKDKLQNGNVCGKRCLVEVDNSEVIETLNYGMETRLLGQPSLCDVETGSFEETSVASMGNILFRETVSGGSEELGGSPGGEFKKEEFIELDPDRMDKSDTLMSKNNEDMREFAAKEIVLYPQDNNYKSRPSDNVLATVGPVAREIVYGLMAVTNCPRKSAFTRPTGPRSERKVYEDCLVWQKRSKAINEERIPEAVAKEIVLYKQEHNNKKRPSENVLVTVGPVAREIVCGLVAAPYCAWGVRRPALTSSVGRTRESKVKKDCFAGKRSCL